MQLCGEGFLPVPPSHPLRLCVARQRRVANRGSTTTPGAVSLTETLPNAPDDRLGQSQADAAGKRGVGSVTATFIVIGSMAGLLGIALVFVFGMAVRTRISDQPVAARDGADAARMQREARLNALGCLGLTLAVLGFAYQIAGMPSGPASAPEPAAGEFGNGSARMVGIFGGNDPNFYLLGE